MKSSCIAAILLLTLAAPSLAQRTKPPPDYKGTCSDANCHDGYARRNFVHGPVSAGACATCHTEENATAHTFVFKGATAELCSFCHEEGHPGSVQHGPFSEGQCTSCHDPHAADVAFFLKAESTSALCADCHADALEGLTHLHGPVAAGGCTACHDAHASNFEAMLFAPKTETCNKCHSEVRDQVMDRAYIHQPVKEDCTHCHNPHGGASRMLLKTSVPQLCYECHEEVATQVKDAKVPHAAVTDGQSCLNCHDPHASDFQFSLLKDPMTLCLSCHDKQIDTPHGPVEDMKKLFAENPSVHGPIAQQQCSGCHVTHGSPHFSLLKKEYPESFYTSYAEEQYALCFECHEADMVRDERTDKLTNFRNGDQNLHFIHVNKDKKGRTCRACHEVHASKQPNHVTDSVKFGKWDLPIHFDKTETGGSCQPGCHKPYKYDRTSAVVNVTKPTTETGRSASREGS